MAERRPPGFNVDLGFYDSEEVLSIPRKIRASAVGVWTLCGSYASNKLSDGYVSAEALRDRGCTPAIRAALTTTKPVPLWDEAHAGGIQFTRWAKWQRTSDEVKSYREADAERKRKARDAKRNAPTSDDYETSGWTDDGPSQSVRPDSGTPKTETETETETTTAKAVVSPRKRGARPKPKTFLPAEYLPEPSTIQAIRAEFPRATSDDLEYQTRKFRDHWAKVGKQMADWDATWRNWIRTSDERGELCRRNGAGLKVVNGGSVVDEKVQGWMDMANSTPGRELE